MKQQTVTYKEVDEAQGARLRELYKQVFGEEDRSKGKADALKSKIKAELERQRQQQARSPGRKRHEPPAVVDSPDVPGWGYKEDRNGQFWAVEKGTEDESGPYDTADAALEAIREGQSRRQRRQQVKASSEALAAEREASKATRAAEKAARTAEKATEKATRAAEKAAAPAAVPAADEAAEGSGKGRDGSGAYIRAAIMAGGKSPAQIVEEVHARFSGSKTTPKEVYWYRWDLKNKGHNPPGWPAQPRRQAPSKQ